MFLRCGRQLKPFGFSLLRHRDPLSPTYWWIADAAGNLTDVSDNRVKMAPQSGGAAGSSGPYGPAALFSGSAGWGETATQPALTSPVSVLIRLAANPWTQTRAGVFFGLNTSGTREWGFELNSNVFSWTGVSGSTRTSLSVSSLGTSWQTFVATDTGGATSGSALLYQNGVKVATGSGSGTAPGAAQVYEVATEGSGAHLFAGWIDEIRVYDYVLSAAQVAIETLDPYWRLRRRRPFGGRLSSAAKTIPYWHLFQSSTCF